jgi:hypothetical protein
MSGTKNLHYATDYQLDELTLITSLIGGKVNLLPFMVELNLFEDIYSSTISGELVVSDALGLISNFFLNGTEYIQLTLRKTTQDNYPIKKNYRIYKIANRSTSESNAYEVYTINFCSEEFLLSEQYRVCKAFKGTEISKIIENILTRYVKVGTEGTKPIFIDATMGVYDFVLPNKKLFETISWLSTYALPKNKTGADMLFFENSDGYFFRSLQTMYEQSVYQTYKFDPKNISDDLNQQMTNALNFEVMDFFDTLGGIANGTFANRVITINPTTRTYEIDNDFNYADYFGKSKKMNKGAVINDYKNRHKKTMFDSPPNELEMGTLRLVTENTAIKKNPYISQNPDAVANDINIRKYMPNRVAQIALANYTRIKITVAGDPSLLAGKTVIFNTYGMNGTKEKKLDPFYSGKYLITAVRHIVKNNSYITVMELAKESVSTPYASYNPTNMQKLVDGKI